MTKQGALQGADQLQPSGTASRLRLPARPEGCDLGWGKSHGKSWAAVSDCTCHSWAASPSTKASLQGGTESTTTPTTRKPAPLTDEKPGTHHPKQWPKLKSDSFPSAALLLQAALANHEETSDKPKLKDTPHSMSVILKMPVTLQIKALESSYNLWCHFPPFICSFVAQNKGLANPHNQLFYEMGTHYVIKTDLALTT